MRSVTGTWKKKGVEVPFWEKEWMGIPFTSLEIELSNVELPVSDFYSIFYSLLKKKYQSYLELPQNWRKSKTDVSNEIGVLIPKNSEVLSFGCGIGFVESVLAVSRPDLKITCYDPMETAKSWAVAEFKNVDFDWLFGNIDNHRVRQFEVIYLCQVLYAVEFEEGVLMLEKLASYLKKGGILILINFSALSHENGDELVKMFSWESIRNLSRLGRQVMKKIFRFSLSRNGQFWGWHRDNQRYFMMLEQAGLEIQKSFPSAKQSFIVAKQRETG